MPEEKQILTMTESKRLIELEAKIKTGLSTFMDVGEALLEIRDSKFYRIEHDTFEAYCRQKWGFSKTQANRLIGASVAVGNLAPNGVKPQSESQARPLTKVTPEKQPLVWQDAVGIAHGGQPTAKQVEQAVEQHEETHTPTPRYKPSDGLQYAEMAINNLQKIQRKDTQRQAAFERVIKWINKNK